MRRPEAKSRPFSQPGMVASLFIGQRAGWSMFSKARYAILFLAYFAFESMWGADGSADDKIPPLRPVKAIIPPGFWEQYAGWVLAGGGVLVGLLVGLIWWLARPKPPIFIPPAAQAHQALGMLRQTPETGILLSKVSQIVRTYFGAAFGLPPGEYTTTEFCRAISGREEVGVTLKEEVDGFLRLCDERKFTPSPPTAPIGAIDRADELIERAEASRLELEKLAQRIAATVKVVPRQTVASNPGAKS